MGWNLRQSGRTTSTDRANASVFGVNSVFGVKLGHFLLAGLLLGGLSSVGLTQNPPQNLPATGRQISGLAESGGGATAGAAGDLIGFSSSDTSGTQTITLVHARKSWMAVYHIDRSGQIRLVSSRPLDADFALQLNATSPLPEEIREIGSR